MRGVRILCAAVIALTLLALTVPQAQARQALFASGCVLPRDEVISADQALAAKDWICHPPSEAGQSHHGWLRVDNPTVLQSPDGGHFESDNAIFGGVYTRVLFADGKTRETYWTQETLAHYWTAGTRYSVPLFDAGERPVSLLVRFDRPFSRNVAVQAALLGKAEALEARTDGMIWFGMLFGTLIASGLFSLVMAAALRHVVTVYHAAMTALMALYSLASSSLIFAFFPGSSLTTRIMFSYISMPLAFALLAPFCMAFIERDMLSPFAKRTGKAIGWILVAIAAIVPVFGESWPFLSRHVYHLAFSPAFFAYAIILGSALRRGSIAVRFLLLAWTMPVLAGLDRVLRGMDIYALNTNADYVFFAAIAAEAVIIAVGVAWRVVDVRRERDKALELERELAHLVNTDALTGLPNRRAFDDRKWRQGDFLAIVDIDNFKWVNDRFGHHAGDQVLRAMGAELASLVTRGKFVGAWRLGGEEFAVLVDARSAGAAALVLNRMRDRVSASVATAVPCITDTITVSAGLAQIDREGVVPAYEAADRALYHAKASGRDRLCFASAEREIATIFPRRSRRRQAA